MSSILELRAEPRGFKKLHVWQLGRQLAGLAYSFSEHFPRSEEFGLKLQLRKAVVSVPSNVAEGWGNGSSAMFVRALKIARGSLYEADTQLILARDFGYLTGQQLDEVGELIHLLGRKLFNLIERVESNIARELRSPYGGFDPEQFSPFSQEFPFSPDDFAEDEPTH